MKARMLDIWARMESGPFCPQKQWDTRVFFPRLKEITKKYGIVYDPPSVVPTDDGLLDAIFRAGYEFLLDIGILNTDTERVIKIKQEEVDDAIRFVRPQITLGEGDEAKVCTWRGLDPTTPPPVLGRILGPQTPELLGRIFESYAQEPIIDAVHFQGVLEEVHGAPIKVGSPFEMIMEMTRVQTVRDALRRVGRPGLHDGASTPVSLQAEMIALHEGWGMHKGDARHVYIMPHMKTDYDQMSRTLTYLEYGSNFWCLGQAYVGGLAGSPATAAVNCVAEMLATMVLYDSTYLGLWTSDALYFSNSSRTSLWAGNHAGAAFNKHVKYPFVGGMPWGILVAGPGSEEYLWESAAGAIGTTVTGSAIVSGCGWQSGKKDGATGYGAAFAGEVGHASVGLPRKKANELVNHCLSKYQDRIENRTLHKTGKPFGELYDLKTLRPTQEFQDTVGKVKGELRELGLAIR